MTRWAAAALVLWLAHPATAKDLYVNNSGTPACSDSTTYANNDAASPWCSIGRAAWGTTSRSSPDSAQAAAAGDTVYVTAGVYSVAGSSNWNSPTYDPVNSGTSDTNRIVFKAVGAVELEYSSGWGPMIGATSVDGVGTRSDYITWDGFTIYDVRAPQSLGSGDSSIGNARCGYVIGCVIQNNRFYGNLSTSLGNNYAGVWLAGSGLGGEGGHSNVVRNNTIKNYLNFGTGYHHNAPGIMTYGIWDSVIENNEIENCGVGIHLKGGGEEGNKNNTVRKNLIYESGGGIVLGTTTGTHLVYQNIVRDSHWGLKFQNHGSGFKGTYYVVNNTFVNNAINDDEGTVGTFSPHSSAVEGLDGVYIYNNIQYRSTGSTAVGTAWWFWDQWAVTFLDYNFYYQITRYKKSETNYATLANWRTALGGCPGAGRECASTTDDPLFVDAGEYDYRLQAESPARTVGRTITAIHGSDGETIPAGAYITGDEVIGPTEGDEPPAPTDPIRWRVRFRAGSLELGSLAVALVWWLRRRRRPTLDEPLDEPGPTTTDSNRH